MNKRILHVSDLKLNYDYAISLNQLNRNSQLDHHILNRFQEFLEMSASQQTDFILLTGDLFETMNSGISEIEAIGDLFQRYPEILFVIAPPEKEKHEDSWYSIMEWPSNVRLLLNKMYLIYEEHNLLFYYNELDESLKESSYRKIRLISRLSECEKNIGEIYSGLISHHQYYDFDNIYSPGSFEPLDFEFASKNGYIEIAWEDNHSEVVFKERTTLQLLKFMIQIEPNHSLNDLIELTKACILDQQNLCYYRFIYSGNIGKDIANDFQNMIKDALSGLVKGEYINNTNKDYYIQEIENQNNDNLIGLFIKDIRSQNLDEQERKNIIEYGLDYLL